MRTRCKGIALISVLLVVVVGTVLAVRMITTQSLSASRAGTQSINMQAREYALGGEELARQILGEDMLSAESASWDHLGEPWANPNLSFEFENGEVSLQIIDLQGLINLNAVTERQNSRTSRWLRTYIDELQVDSAFQDRIVDWVDSDNAIRGLGAEEYDYLALARPFRPADGPITDISELRLLLDMTPEVFELLNGGLTALPINFAFINVNTAPASVLQSLSPGLTLAQAESMVLARDAEGGYASIASFLSQPELAGLGVVPAGLGVQSRYFRVQVRARYLDRYAYLSSVIERNPTLGVMQVIYRDHSRKFFPVLHDDKLDGDQDTLPQTEAGDA